MGAAYLAAGRGFRARSRRQGVIDQSDACRFSRGVSATTFSGAGGMVIPTVRVDSAVHSLCKGNHRGRGEFREADPSPSPRSNISMVRRCTSDQVSKRLFMRQLADDGPRPSHRDPELRRGGLR